MGWGAEYIGVLLPALGVVLSLARRKLRFNRRNHFGVEQFPNYWAQTSRMGYFAIFRCFYFPQDL
jgi:hypothetical protein